MNTKNICKKHKVDNELYISVDASTIPSSILDELSGNVYFDHVTANGDYIFMLHSSCGKYMITFCVDAIEYDIICADNNEDWIDWNNETYYMRVD